MEIAFLLPRLDRSILSLSSSRTGFVTSAGSCGPGGALTATGESPTRYERGSTIVTSNLPFEDWTSVLGSERLTGALLDRLTHHVSILTMNGDSYRLKQSAASRRVTASGAEQNQATPNVDPDTGEILTP